MKYPTLNVIGLMSGTSMDGLDLALVEFSYSHQLNYRILARHAIAYDLKWKSKLVNAFHNSQSEIEVLDFEYGTWLGSQVNDFIKSKNLCVDLIASHGHTIFHQPINKFTLQIGNGKAIFEQTNIPVVNNFRQQDVLLGGQGAPLVPMGDKILFADYQYCLNLGGFSNISWNDSNQRRACDLSPCNILLNAICQRIPLNYDAYGSIAAIGKSINHLLSRWNAISFYKQAAPKSLGREWFEQNFSADIQNENYTVEDLLATAVQHIAIQINQFIQITQQNILTTNNPSQLSRCLVTGGGAYNSYLMKQLKVHSISGLEYFLPESELIDFKEALLFALLGYLRWNDEINVLASVTGAVKDHSSGDIYRS